MKTTLSPFVVKLLFLAFLIFLITLAVIFQEDIKSPVAQKLEHEKVIDKFSAMGKCIEAYSGFVDAYYQLADISDKRELAEAAQQAELQLLDIDFYQKPVPPQSSVSTATSNSPQRPDLYALGLSNLDDIKKLVQDCLEKASAAKESK